MVLSRFEELITSGQEVELQAARLLSLKAEYNNRRAESWLLATKPPSRYIASGTY